MAVTLKKVNAATAAYTAGDRLFVHADISGDSSYPTGGSVLTPKMLGMTELHYVAVGGEPSSGTLAVYDYAAGKLKVFTGAGAEVVNGTNQSGLTWRLFAVGKGWPTLP